MNRHRLAWMLSWLLICPTLPASETSPAFVLELELHESPLSVRFRNISENPVKILKPLDGSEWGWIMPHYMLSVMDETGQDIPFRPRCDLFGYPYSDTSWPNDYVVPIPPGGTYDQALEVNRIISQSKLYELQFEYVFLPTSNSTPGGPYPEGLWRGQSMSKKIKVYLEANARSETMDQSVSTPELEAK